MYKQQSHTKQHQLLPFGPGLEFHSYDYFLNSIDHLLIHNRGEMSSSQKKAVITFIEKQGKDWIFIKNWRPISLVNVDAKIVSKAIVARIKKVLPSIIYHVQTGYVNDRFIGETVRSIFVGMRYHAIWGIFQRKHLKGFFENCCSVFCKMKITIFRSLW